MEKEKNLVNNIKDLMKKYGFYNEEKPEFKSFKSGESIFQAYELKTENEFFQINEESGEREPAKDDTYKVDNFNVEVKDGKIVSVEEVKFAEAKLADGTVLMISGDEIAVGAEVVVSTEEGQIPAPDGEYELEDGSVLIVIDGLVSELRPAQAPAEPVEAEEQEMSDIEGLYALLEGFINNVGERLSALEGKFETFDGNYKSLKEDYENFKKLPGGKPISTKKFQSEGDSNESETLQRVRQIIKNKK